MNFDRLVRAAVSIWDGEEEVKRLNDDIANGITEEMDEIKETGDE